MSVPSAGTASNPERVRCRTVFNVWLSPAFIDNIEPSLPRRRLPPERVGPVSSLPRAEAGHHTHTILIVDDSAVIRRSLRFWIEQDSDWNVCGEAENGKMAVEKVEELHPDIVILDFQMPVMNGLEAARRITVLAPNTAMVMFTMHSSEQLVKDAGAAGIQNVVSKSDDLTGHLLASLKSLSHRS